MHSKRPYIMAGSSSLSRDSTSISLGQSWARHCALHVIIYSSQYKLDGETPTRYRLPLHICADY